MSSNGNSFGAELRRLREARGWSLAKAEVETGIPVAVLGSYERGQRKPTADKLDEIFGYYGKRLVAVDVDGDLEDRVVAARKLDEVRQIFLDAYNRIVEESA